MSEFRVMRRRDHGFAAGFVETDDGAHIYVEQAGRGKPVLFVHGWTMSGRFWRRQFEGLVNDVQVITMDMRAHGNSSKILHGHTVPRYAKDVRSVIESLDLNGVTLIGWSLAGPVVLDYWQNFGSDRLAALGLAEMTPFPFSPEDWNSHALKAYNLDGMNSAFQELQEQRKVFGRRFIDSMFKKGAAPAEEMEWMLKDHLKTPVSVATAIYSDYLIRDYTMVLETVNKPAIVFSGESNALSFGIKMGEYLCSRLPKGQFVPFDHSGHMPFYEEPELFNTSLLKFLRRV